MTQAFSTCLTVSTGSFIMFSVIANIYKNKTRGPTLIKLFTATRKLKKDFWQLEMFDVCTTGDTAHIYTIHASTWVYRYSSLLQWSVSLGQWDHVAMVGRSYVGLSVYFGLWGNWINCCVWLLPYLTFHYQDKFMFRAKMPPQESCFYTVHKYIVWGENPEFSFNFKQVF
jgi:hypothetical protein